MHINPSIRYFLDGATKPGLIPVVGALFVALFLFLGICLKYNTELVKAGGRWVYLREGDVYGYLSVMTERLRASSSSKPLVLYGGASSAGRALVSPGYFAELVKQDHPDFEVVSFWAGGLSFWELEAIAVAAKGVNSDRDVTLLLSCPITQIASPHFLNSPQRERLLLSDRSYWDRILMAEGIDAPRRKNIMVLDNLDYFSARTSLGLILHYVKSPAPPPTWYNSGTPDDWYLKNNQPFVPEKVIENQKEAAFHLAKAYQEEGISLARCQRVLSRLKSENVNAILFETPFNYHVFKQYVGEPKAREIFQSYQQQLTALARNNRVSFIRAATMAKITSDDFRDLSHIGNPSARSSYTIALVEGLVSNIGGRVNGS